MSDFPHGFYPEQPDVELAKVARHDGELYELLDSKRFVLETIGAHIIDGVLQASELDEAQRLFAQINPGITKRRTELDIS